ncbi:MAG: zinc ribbon domain-containing protein [Turicibacter sp.]|nr:zinc ribbon domain-containing protein [Turicibacter sp.]
MSCTNCQNPLAVGAKFCNKCGKAQKQSTQNSQICGYWLLENSNNPSYLPYINQEIKMINHYLPNGTGAVYYVDESLVTIGNGALYCVLPFRWQHETAERIIYSLNIDGNQVVEGMAFGIQGTNLTTRLDDGTITADIKLSDNFGQVLFTAKDGSQTNTAAEIAGTVGSIVGSFALGFIEGMFEY